MIYKQYIILLSFQQTRQNKCISKHIRTRKMLF